MKELNTIKGKRMLAAIMFTDMIGYTALMQNDEQQAKQNRDRHRLIQKNAVYKYKGEEIQIRCLTILIKALKQKKVI